MAIALFAGLAAWSAVSEAASIHYGAPYRSLPAHGEPVEILPGNLDGNSFVDLVAVNHGSRYLSLFLGNGDGTFQVRPLLETSAYPTAGAFGDLDEDGFDDWVVCGGTPTLVIHWGGPSGPGAPQTLAAPSGAVSCLVARADDDAHLDLLIVRSPNVLSIRRGNGNGTFAAPVDLAAGADARGIAAGDLNADGHPDIVVGHTSGASVAVFYGNGDGTFDAPVNVAMSSGPFQLAIADLNDDDRLDLIAGGAGLSTRLGNPAGGFAAVQSFSAPGTDAGLAIADVNLDGRPDVLATGISGLAILIGDGHGGLLPASTHPIGRQPGRMSIGDFNGDGIPDVAAIGERDNLEPPIAIALGVGDGTFPPLRVLPPAGDVVRGIQIGDTNGDGHADLVLGTSAGELSTYLGDGAGAFPDRRTGIALTQGWLRLGDFDEDGVLDLVDADEAGFAIRHGAGDGTFTTSPYFASGPIVGGVDIGDVGAIEADGHLDVVSTYNRGGMVHRGDGTGVVGPGSPIETNILSYQTRRVDFADINGDGRDDLISSHLDRGPTVVLSPNYSSALSFTSTSLVFDLDTGDFDRDGKLDVVTAYPYIESGQVWKGAGNGTFTSLGTYDCGGSPDIRTGRFNAGDSIDFAVLAPDVGTIAIYAGHGDGTFAGREDFGVGGFCSTMEAGDLDSDGVSDFAVALNDKRVALLLSSGAPRLPIVEHLSARIFGPTVQVVWVAQEPTRWTEFAVERAAAGDGSWQRLDLTATTQGDSSMADDPAPPDGSIWYRLAARTSDGQWIVSGPVPARDELVPALVSLESARVERHRVRLRWLDATRTVGSAVVERAGWEGGWESLAPVHADGSGLIEFVDESVRPGARYGYRLAFEDEGTRVTRGETWVEIPPAATMRIVARSPQTAGGGLDLSWQLDRSGDAMVRVYDLAGREVAAQRVRANDSEVHRERLAPDARLAPGLYVVTLQRDDRRTSARVIVTR